MKTLHNFKTCWL